MYQLEIEKALQMLQKYKIPFSACRIAISADKAADAAEKLGFPVAIKIVSKDIIHKSDVGGVKTNLTDKESVKTAYEQMIKNVRKKMQKAKLAGVYVQKMEKGIEAIVGMKRDAQFGPVIMFGLGGVFVEILKDVSFRITPVNKQQALDMISSIKSLPVLKGARGGKAANLDAIADIIAKVSKISENSSIAELDFNPVIVNEESAVVVDTRIMIK